MIPKSKRSAFNGPSMGAFLLSETWNDDVGWPIWEATMSFKACREYGGGTWTFNVGPPVAALTRIFKFSITKQYTIQNYNLGFQSITICIWATPSGFCNVHNNSIFRIFHSYSENCHPKDIDYTKPTFEIVPTQVHQSFA